MSDHGFLLGRIAVRVRLITMDQLNEATTQQGREPGKNIGRILIERGLINERQLEEVIKIQKDYLAKRKAQQAAAVQAPAVAPASAGQPATASAAAPGATVRLDRAAIVQTAGAQAAPPASAPPAPAATAVAEPPPQKAPPAATGAAVTPAPEPRSDPAAGGATSGRLNAIQRWRRVVPTRSLPRLASDGIGGHVLIGSAVRCAAVRARARRVRRRDDCR